MGCPVDIDMTNFMGTLLVDNVYAGLRCVLRDGRMCFSFKATSTTSSARRYLYLYFSSGQAYDMYLNTDATIGPANQCFGFSIAQKIYMLSPDHGGMQDNINSTRLRLYDGCPCNPIESAMSPLLIDCNPLTDIIISTNSPSDSRH